ncbi:DNA-binding transcriptional regulator, ArsR family [Asanoa hainanensis]|uniref:DNA-binding transcriptional regulator, ArsR family n=1 Tax=Asanoa hainanensis TaxID=560556 RepID=A0A239GAD1_9ACTN|nr:winged helix-turn-helix domain-containing protein [Asanoa hainanensis]SNS66286.1 DNA-binding transcriptional regulator, ArsR family [Asanoa hainanensis]
MRIHFTRLDLARTQLADGPDPMWETVNSLQALQGRYGQADLAHWRSETAHELRGSGLATAVRHQLFPLVPHAAYFPDLVTPLEGALGLEAGIDAMLSTPRSRIAAEIDQLKPDRAGRAQLERFRDGRASDLAACGDLIRAYYKAAVDRIHETITAAVDRDLAVRRTAIHTGGVEGMLSSYEPLMRWRYPVLELPSHPSARDVHLQGRGLRLIPSYFCRTHPLTVYDGSLPQVVVYPVRHTAEAGDNQALARLLGETRAAVLISIHKGCGTGQLAERVGISAPATSHHIGVLREAGLVASSRSGTTVHHTRSRLGDALVRRHRSGNGPGSL